MKSPAHDKSFMNVNNWCVTFTIVLLLCLSQCHRDPISDKQSVEAGTTIESPGYSQSPEDIVRPLSPKLLWKRYIGFGKIQLLLTQGDRAYYYLESPGARGKVMTVTAIDHKTGKRIYQKRDWQSRYSKPVMTNGILYYTGTDSYNALDLLRGKQLIQMDRGEYHPVLPLEKTDRTIILEKVSSRQPHTVQSILCLDLKSHRVKWQKAFNHREISLSRRHIAVEKEDGAIVVLDRMSGRVMSSVGQSIISLKGKKKILKLLHGVLYIKAGDSIVAIDCQSGIQRWQKSISERHTEYVASASPVIVFRTGDKIYAYRVDNGTVLWKNIHKGNVNRTVSDRVIVMMTEESLYGIDIYTGKTVWKLSHIDRRGYPSYKNKEYIYFKAMSNGQYFIRTVNPLVKPKVNVYRTRDNAYDCYMRSGLNLKKIGSITYLGSVSAIIPGVTMPNGTQLTLKAFDSGSGEEIWRNKLFTGDYMSHPILIGSSVVLLDSSGSLIALQHRTGKVAWRYDIPQTRDSQGNRAPFQVLKGNDTIVYVYYGGQIYALDYKKLEKPKENVKSEGA